MPHEVDESTGEAAAYFAERPAWHRLGTVVEEAVDSGQALKLSRLDWSVVQMPLVAEMPKGKKVPGISARIGVPGFYANVRSDNEGVLGVVSKIYKPVQNAEAFEFMDKLLKSGEIVKYESAGALKDGKVVWMLARLPSEARIADVDQQLSYVLITNRHDGAGAIRIIPTNVRVVCWNTLSWAVNSVQVGFSISHTGDVTRKVTEAREAIGLSIEGFSSYIDMGNRLSGIKIRDAEADNFFVRAVGPQDEEPQRMDRRDDWSPVNRYAFDTVSESYHDGESAAFNGEFKDTAWAALNAVTGYWDHRWRSAGKSEVRDKNRLYGSWLGKGAKEKRRASLLAEEVFLN